MIGRIDVVHPVCHVCATAACFFVLFERDMQPVLRDFEIPARRADVRVIEKRLDDAERHSGVEKP